MHKKEPRFCEPWPNAFVCGGGLGLVDIAGISLSGQCCQLKQEPSAPAFKRGLSAKLTGGVCGMGFRYVYAAANA